MLCIKSNGISFFVLTILYFVTGHNCDQKSEHYISGPRIVGGRDALPGELPFQVAILWRRYSAGHFTYLCGGSIINSEYVLTAGHCVNGLSPADLQVVAGVLNYNPESSEDTKVVRKVTDVLVHEEFNISTLINDMAILKVSPGFPSDNSAVQAIPLRKEAALDGVKCTVSGWGLLEEHGNSLPENLQTTIVHFMTFEECRSRYKNYDQRTIEPGMICAIFLKMGSDACDGDSGGPLQCGGLLTGVVSWGDGCASPDHPGVYADVAYYNDWIEGKLHKSKDEL